MDPARSCDSASTMTRTSGSVPDGRSSTRPGGAELALRLGDGGGQLGRRRDAGLVHVRHVDQDLRQPAPSRRPARRAACRSRRRGRPACSPVSVPSPVVAWSSMMTWPGLLAAERVAVALHRLQHVAVADRGLHQVDALALHRQLEAEVGHDGGDDGVLGAARRARAWPAPGRRGSGRRRPPRPRRPRPGSGRRRRRARCRGRRRARATAALQQVQVGASRSRR